MAKAVCMGASLQCSFGVAPSSLIVLPANRVLTGTPMATIMDFAPVANVPPFGMCSSPANPVVIAATAAALGVPTPAPCIPVPTGPWVPGSPTVLVGGMPALNDTSKLMCAWAGVIQITAPGQGTVEVPDMPANQYPDIATAVVALAAAGVNRTIVQRGDATGDQAHVVPVLAIYPTYGVLVIDALAPPAPGVATHPRGLNMANSYVDHFHFAVGRVAYVNLPVPVNQAIGGNLPHGMQRMNLTTTTDFTVNAILASAANRTAIKAAFRGPKLAAAALPAAGVGLPAPVLRDIALDQFRVALGIPLNRHIVVLWGRKSGKRGGLYPQFDHSTTGMAQISRRCSANGYTVLLAGDITQAKVGPHDFGANAIWLGDFWNRFPAALPPGRDTQIRFFYVMMRMLKAQLGGHHLLHVGMRSGGLDMYGFSGQRILYIVGPAVLGGAVNDNRMSVVSGHIQAARAAGAFGAYSFGRYQATRIPKAYGHVRARGFLIADENALVIQIAAALV